MFADFVNFQLEFLSFGLNLGFDPCRRQSPLKAKPLSLSLALLTPMIKEVKCGVEPETQPF